MLKSACFVARSALSRASLWVEHLVQTGWFLPVANHTDSITDTWEHIHSIPRYTQKKQLVPFDAGPWLPLEHRWPLNPGRGPRWRTWHAVDRRGTSDSDPSCNPGTSRGRKVPTQHHHGTMDFSMQIVQVPVWPFNRFAGGSGALGTRKGHPIDLEKVGVAALFTGCGGPGFDATHLRGSLSSQHKPWIYDWPTTSIDRAVPCSNMFKHLFSAGRTGGFARNWGISLFLYGHVKRKKVKKHLASEGLGVRSLTQHSSVPQWLSCTNPPHFH